MKFQISILLAIILMLISCNKKKQTLPPITQSGENTFACKIDGEVFVIFGKRKVNSVSCTKGNTVYDFTSNFYISSESCSNDFYRGIDFSVFYPLKVDVYDLGANSNSSASSDHYPNSNYSTDSTRIGELHITRADHIIAGTFWFDAIDRDGNIIHVTEGRFDLMK